MSKETIKMNPVRMLLLRAALKKEELRLQNAASQVARIASGLEMEVAAKANIDASLSRLRKQLKQDSEDMATMQRMADLAMSELTKKDEDLANRARNLDGTMHRFTSLAAAAAALGTVTASTSPLLNLGSQIALDAGNRLGSLFDLADNDLMDTIISSSGLDGLIGDTSGMYEYNGNGNIPFSGAAVAAGAVGAIGVATGVAAASALTDLWDHRGVKQMTSSSSGNTGSSKKSKKKKGLLSSIGSAFGGAVDWVGDKVSDATDYVGDKFSDAVDWASDKLSDAKDAVVDGAKWVGDKAGDVWDGVKKVANSKPVQYVLDMGGSLVGAVADVGSFCGNIVTGRWDLAAIDTYSVINNFFDFSQDLSALAVYGIGAGMDAFGASDNAVQYCYDFAEDYANREGLAGELGAAGWETGETVLEAVDLGVGAYKFGSGLSKFQTAWSEMEWNDLGDLKDNLLSMSGWKDGDSLEKLTGVPKQIEQYEIITSNVELGYKYVDGLVENISSDGGIFDDGGLLGDGGLINTMLSNTSPGKLIDGLFKTSQGGLELGYKISENTSSEVGKSAAPNN